MKIFNEVTAGTSQGGARKGALMLSIDARHKEAETFIRIKSQEGLIEKANLSSETLNLMDDDAVPEDAQCLIINAPTSDFSEDDANKVITYLNNGGNLLITTNSEVTDNMPNFESILSTYGITRQKGMIAESDTTMYYQNPFYLLPDVSGSVFTSGTSGA